MWERFTERARRLVFLAQEEAANLGENYVSTEHLLLGLVREDDSVAAGILNRLGVPLESVRGEIERQVARGDSRPGQDMQLTPRAKRVIDLADDEARQLSNNYVGTEHLLLGLIREGEGLAGRVLAKLGVYLEPTRREVLALQETDQPADPDTADQGLELYSGKSEDVSPPPSGAHEPTAETPPRVWHVLLGKDVTGQNESGPSREAAALLERLRDCKERMKHGEASAQARRWWQAFELQNLEHLNLVVYVAEETVSRSIDLDDLFRAYFLCESDNVYAVLCCADVLRFAT